MMKNQNLRAATLLPLLFRLGGAQLPATCATAGCFDTITESQDCLRQCTNEFPVPAYGGDSSASLLWQCLSPGRTTVFDTSSVMGELIGCCAMDSYDDSSLGHDCRSTMLEAQQCATTQACIDPCVKQTALEYLQCVQGAKVSGTCPFAAFCMGTLFNDPQLDAAGNPVLGTNSLDFADILATAAGSSIATATCTPFEPFVSKVCELGNNCCSACNAKLGALTNCLVNNFVLPLYKLETGAADNGLTCPVSESPCGLAAAGTVTGRSGGRSRLNATPARNVDRLAAIASARNGGRDLADEAAADNATEFTVNITECEAGMSINWIAHNESYAAGEYFNCIGTKMIGIIATEDDEDSTGASSAWRMASLGVSSMVAVAVASVL